MIVWSVFTRNLMQACWNSTIHNNMKKLQGVILIAHLILCTLSSCSFRCTWFPARVAGLSGGGLRPQLHLQLFLCQSGWRQHCRQCWKFAPCDPWWPGGPWRYPQWNWREDKQTHRVPLHQVHTPPLVFWAILLLKHHCCILPTKGSSRCICEVRVFVKNFSAHCVHIFRCLCNMYVVLLVVGIQCLEYCVVVAQSIRAAVGAWGHHTKEPQLQEHGATLQLPTPCRLCLQGVQVRW